jgi:rubrerythrin
MKLTQKECGLLKDLKGQEKLCADKYAKHAAAAADPQLRDLFAGLSKIEQQHHDTLTQIESGGVPQAGAGENPAKKFTAAYGAAETPEKQADSYLCTDLLAAEKHASHLYDTCVFEFRDEALRKTLNHIQKEEQEHGKLLYDYMAANGMYS